MIIYFISNDVPWMAEHESVLTAHIPGTQIEKISVTRREARLLRTGFHREWIALEDRIARSECERNHDAGCAIGLFDFSAYGFFGDLNVCDHTGGGNLFASLVLRFPSISWFALGGGGIALGPTFPADRAIEAAALIRTVELESRSHFGQLFDKSGLRAFLKNFASQSVCDVASGVVLPGVRSAKAVVIDDDARRAAPLALAAYLAGAKVATILSGAALEEDLGSAPPAGTTPFDVSIEPLALDYASRGGIGALDPSARRTAAPGLAAVPNVVIVSADKVTPINLQVSGTITRIGLPEQSLGDLIDRLSPTFPRGSYVWPPPENFRVQGDLPHQVPSHLEVLARGMLADARILRDRFPLIAAIYAADAQELSFARSAYFSADATMQLFGSRLTVELANPGMFHAENVTRNSDQLAENIEATLPGFNTKRPERRRLRRRLLAQAYGRLVDLYRGSYHFEEEMELLARIREVRSRLGIIGKYLSFTLSGIGQFAFATFCWIVLFAVLYAIHALTLPVSLDLQGAFALLCYSGATFVTIGVAPSEWLTGFGMGPSNLFPFLIWLETIVAAIHWGLGLAQAFLWLSRR